MNGVTVVVFLACVAMALAADYRSPDCGADGIFAKGDRSIVFCSGGVATYQKCADKTRHSYQASHGPYGYGAGFCDVNENDYNTGYGYGAPRHFGY